MLAYLARITACENSKNLSKFIKAMYDRVFDESFDNYYDKLVIFLNDLKINDCMPTDREFEEALIHKTLYKKPICKYVLSVIENSTNEHIDTSNLAIEHILPQKENAAVWKKEVGDEYDKVYEMYLHTLGNLTITGHNSKLGTRPFNDKKSIIRDNSKTNVLNSAVLAADKWDETSILSRAKALADILINEFEYVEMHSDVNESNELSFGVDSGISFSNTKPEGFSFMSEYMKVSSWADMLTKFISVAYDLYTVVFLIWQQGIILFLTPIEHTSVTMRENFENISKLATVGSFLKLTYLQMLLSRLLRTC